MKPITIGIGVLLASGPLYGVAEPAPGRHIVRDGRYGLAQETNA